MTEAENQPPDPTDDYLEQLRDELQSDELRNALFTALGHYRARKLKSNADEHKGPTLAELLQIDSSFDFAEFFQSKLLKRFEPPYPITAAELGESAKTYLCGLTPEIHEDARRFAVGHFNFAAERACRDRCGTEHSHSSWVMPSRDSAPDDLWVRVWQSPSGFSIVLKAEVDNIASSADGRTCRLFWQVWTVCATEAALAAAEEKLRLPVDQALHALSNVDPGVPDPLIVALTRTNNDLIADSVEVDKYVPCTPILETERTKAVIATCIECGLADGAFGGDDLPKSIWLALHFLSQADKQELAAIRVALCFSAIEALLSSKSAQDGVVAQLANHGAALLFHDRHERPAAIKKVRSLYAYRCNTVHGASLQEDTQFAQEVRRLASAVLVAAIEWLCHHRAQQESHTKQQFLEELQHAFQTGEPVTGAPTDLAGCLAV